MAIGTVARCMSWWSMLVSRLKARVGARWLYGFKADPSDLTPTFVIRKHLKRVIPLDEQVAQGTLTAWQATVLREALRIRRNIIMVGRRSLGRRCWPIVCWMRCWTLWAHGTIGADRR